MKDSNNCFYDEKKYLRINVQGLEAAASLYTRRKKMRKSAIWLPNNMKTSGGIQVNSHAFFFLIKDFFFLKCLAIFGMLQLHKKIN